MTFDALIPLFARLTQPRYLIATLSITVGLVSMLVYQPLSEFQLTDPAPKISPLLPKKRAESAESAVPIKVGLLIQNFPKFDIIANEFTADITLWFEFDPSLITLETVDKFSFSKGTIKKKTLADMKIDNGKLFAQYTIRLTFSSPLDHTLFPLNDHRLYIILKNEYVVPSELIYLAPRSSFLIDSHAYTGDWLIVEHATKTGYFESQLDEFDPLKTVIYPAVIFSIDLAKRGVRKIFIVMLPMFILFMIASFTFLMNPEELGRSILSLSTGTLTGIIAYRFVIEKIAPDVGYFTLTDHLFNLFLISIFIIFVMNIFTVTQEKDTIKTRAIKGVTLLLAQIVIVGSFYYLLR